MELSGTDSGGTTSGPRSAPKRQRCESGASAGSGGRARCAILLYTDRRPPVSILGGPWTAPAPVHFSFSILRVFRSHAAVGRAQKAARAITEPSLLPRTSQPAATSASASYSGGSSSSASESDGGSEFSAASESSSGGTSELSEVADSQEEPCSAPKPANKVRQRVQAS